MWPDDLRALVDALIEDEKAIWTAMGIDPVLPRATSEIRQVWLDILDRASAYEARIGHRAGPFCEPAAGHAS